MGTYLYGVKKTNPIKAAFQGERISINRLQYITKPSHTFLEGENLGRIGRLVVGKIKSVWGDQLPKYVAVLDKNEQGVDYDYQAIEVYADVPSVLWYDCDDISKNMIGYLFRRGKKYFVLTVKELNAAIVGATMYYDIKHLLQNSSVFIDPARPNADIVTIFYKKHRMGGTVLCPESTMFVG